MNGREYRIETLDLTGKSDVYDTVSKLASAGGEICRIVLTGEYDGEIDTAALQHMLEDRFFHTEFKIETRPSRDIWSEAEDDTLKGLFIRRMRAKYDAAVSDDEKKQIFSALQFGIGALENREEWRQ